MTIIYVLSMAAFAYSFILHQREKGNPVGLAAYAFALRYSFWWGFLTAAGLFCLGISGTSIENQWFASFAFPAALVGAPIIGFMAGVLMCPFLYLGAFAYYRFRKQGAGEKDASSERSGR